MPSVAPDLYTTIPPNDILDLRGGVGQVAVAFRWDLLDADYNQIGEIHPERGASIDHNTTSTVMRTVRGVRLAQAEFDEIDIFADRVRPSMTLSDGSTWPMGVFYFTTDQHHVSSAQTSLDTILLDQGFALNTVMPNSFGLSNGTLVSQGLVQLVNLLGITRYAIDGSSAKISGGPVSWPPDTTALSVLRDLCRRAGFFAPYFDNSGTLVMRLVDDLVPDVGHDYTSVNSRILVDTLTTSTNLLTAPNAYKVIATGATTSVAASVAYIDSSLPHSRENRGFTITEVHRVQGVSTPQECQTIAIALANQDARQYATAEFSSVLDPRHDSFGVVQLDGETYREVGWSAELKPGGTHRHSLVKRIV